MLRFFSLIIVVFTTSISIVAQSKPIKRKYRGVYEGLIPSYQVHLGADVFEVSTVKIRVFVDRDSLFLEIGNYHFGSDYSVTNNRSNYTLTATRSESGIPEEMVLDTKSRTLTRKGLYPQPDVILERLGRLPRR